MTCKCGSETHKRITHRNCYLNKNKEKKIIENKKEEQKIIKNDKKEVQKIIKNDKKEENDLSLYVDKTPTTWETVIKKQLYSYFNNDFKIYNVKSDGNCQFRSVALFFKLCKIEKFEKYKDIEYSGIRSDAIIELNLHKDDYSPFYEGDYIKYVEEMGKDGTYGDNLSLRAISQIYQLNIDVFSFEYHDYYKIDLNVNEEDTDIFLIYYKEHYMLLMPNKS